MKTLRLKRDQNGKRKNYLTPRQHLFLNGSRLTLKGKKPIKTTLLRRISRFYRRKLRRMDISYFNPTLTVKNLKYKSSLLTLKKRSSQFTLKTLSDIKFNNIRFNMFKIIRRGKSRLKLRRTKKYYSYFNRILNINLISYLFTTILKHYRFSRVRYLNRFFRHHARRYKINTFGLFFRTLPSIPLFNSRNHLYDITITPSVLQEYFGSSYETFSTYPSNLEKLIQTKFENLFTTRSKLSMLSPIYRLFKRDNDFNRHTVISSKYKTPFILSTIGFVFIQTIYTKNSSYVKSALNRFRYSFFFKKDLKRYLLKKPGKLKLLTSSLLFTNYKIRDERPSIALLHSD